MNATSSGPGVNARSTRTAASDPTSSSDWRSGASNEHSIAAVNPPPKSSHAENDASTPDAVRALPGYDFDGTRILSSDDVLLLDHVPERVAVMRKAFTDTAKDPQMLAEAEKSKIDMTYILPARLEELVDKLYRTPPELIETVKRLVPNLQ